MASRLDIKNITCEDLADTVTHSKKSLLLLDCHPVLSYMACHISGAVNINLTSLLKKRLKAGRVGVVDLVGTDKLEDGQPIQVVVYDDCTRDPRTLSSDSTVLLVIAHSYTLTRN